MKLFQFINQSGDPEPVMKGKYNTARKVKMAKADKNFRPFVLVLWQILKAASQQTVPDPPLLLQFAI